MTKDEALTLCKKLSYFDDGHYLITLDDIKHVLDEIFPEKKKALILTPIPNNYTNINQEAFNEWMAYKKYKNKGAIPKTLNMLNKYDYQTQQDIVDKSIMNEYKGLFEPKQQKQQMSFKQQDSYKTDASLEAYFKAKEQGLDLRKPNMGMPMNEYEDLEVIER